MKTQNPILAMVAAVLFLTVVSGIAPYDRATWIFELLFGLIEVGVLVAISPRIRFSNLVYFLVVCHFAILAVGAQYTYAEVPLFNWLRDEFGLARNHYDRVGHFAQGFFPAILIREILIRVGKIEKGWLCGFLSVLVCLAFSAFYEIVEFVWVILFYPDKGPEWLGMQGDPWDAQWDMTMALVGASLSVALLSKWHNRSMVRCSGKEPVNNDG